MAPRKQKEIPLLLICHLCSQENNKNESNQTMEITEARFKMCLCAHKFPSCHNNSTLFKERDNICQQIDLWLCPWTDLHTASTARETNYQWYNQEINQTIRTAFTPSVQSSGQQINTKTRQSTNQTK